MLAPTSTGTLVRPAIGGLLILRPDLSENLLAKGICESVPIPANAHQQRGRSPLGSCRSLSPAVKRWGGVRNCADPTRWTGPPHNMTCQTIPYAARKPDPQDLVGLWYYNKTASTKRPTRIESRVTRPRLLRPGACRAPAPHPRPQALPLQAIFVPCSRNTQSHAS